MVSPEVHASSIGRLFQRPPTESVALIDAAGRILAHSVTAVADSPRFDNSQMDGYALSAAHLKALPEGRSVTVGPTLAAGTDPDILFPDGIGADVVPIMTGAKIPQGTAAIVPVEHCDPDRFPGAGHVLKLPTVVEDGQFIRQAGSDIRTGDLLLSAGTRLGAVAIGVLAGQNLSEVEVFARHRALICTGGAEIGDVSAARIPDSNGPMLQVLCEQAGIDVVGHVRTNDHPEELAGELEQAVRGLSPTVIITSGGISAGEFEVVRQVLEPEGWFGHVEQQPGGPQGWATFDGVPVICLPGNPISTLVSFRLFVAPLLGYAPIPEVVPIGVAAAGLPAKEQFLRGRREGKVVVPVGGAGSHLLAQAIDATCLIRVPAGGVPAGADVTVYPL